MRALLAALLAFSSAAQAARPFVTDDARTVDKGGCQVETFYKRQRKFHEHEFWFLPACNPRGLVELTLGGTWVDSAQPGDSRSVIVQDKTLLKPLDTNGYGFALTVGAGRVRPFEAPRVTSPYLNGIASTSFYGDRVVGHFNLGLLRDRQIGLTRGTWGAGAEVRINSRLYGIAETYGQRRDRPTVHGGLRFWLLPERLQVDATLGRQHAAPIDRSFYSVGLRVLW